jgi:hypothetical protein
VAGREYGPLNTGVSIIRGNSGNGALPIPAGEQGEDKNDTRRQATHVQAADCPGGFTAKYGP